MANEKTCVIVSSGPDCDWERLRGRLPADAFVICADGGYAHCARLGLSCSLLVGDMDSFSGDAPPASLAQIRVSSIKDDTDLELAMREGLRRGFADFLVVDSLAGRPDHVWGNVQCLWYLTQHACTAKLLSPTAEVFFLRGGEQALLLPEDYHFFSLFAYAGDARGVTIENAKYPLSDATLRPDMSLGISNEFLPGGSIVRLREGTLLVMKTRA